MIYQINFLFLLQYCRFLKSVCIRPIHLNPCPLNRCRRHPKNPCASVQSVSIRVPKKIPRSSAAGGNKIRVNPSNPSQSVSPKKYPAAPPQAAKKILPVAQITYHIHSHRLQIVFLLPPPNPSSPHYHQYSPANYSLSPAGNRVCIPS